MNEDYTRARVLGRIEHMGEQFTISREQRHGKPTKHYVLLHQGAIMARSRNESLEYAMEQFRAEFAATFPSGKEDYFKESLAAQYDRNKRRVPLP